MRPDPVRCFERFMLGKRTHWLPQRVASDVWQAVVRWRWRRG